MRWLIALALVVLLARRAEAAAPIGDPVDASPATRDLHHRAGLAHARGDYPEALALYEDGARRAPEPAARAMFLYEEAALLIGLQRIPEAFATIDRLVAEPAHPRFGCVAPPPSAVHLYRELAVRNSRELLERAREHERLGRHVEAFEEARASTSALPGDIASHVGRVNVHLTRDGAILFEGIVYGPADHFECAAPIEAPRSLHVTARSITGATTEGWVVAQRGPASVLDLAFPDAPVPPEAAPPRKTDASNDTRALFYIGVGLGGGAVGATGSSSTGEGHAASTLWLLSDSGNTSLLLTATGTVGASGRGILVAGRWRFELGRRLALHDTASTGHGLFLRGGLEGRLLVATPLVEMGAIDLPTASAGYALFADPFIVEVGFRGGLSLLGRYQVEAGSRHFEVAPDYGPFASVHLGPVHLDGVITRSESLRSRGTPVDYANGTMCLTAGFLGLCAETTYARSEVPKGADVVRSDALYVGATAVLTIDTTGSPFLLPDRRHHH